MMKNTNLSAHPARTGITRTFSWRHGRRTLGGSRSKGRELFYQLGRTTMRARFITPITGTYQEFTGLLAISTMEFIDRHGEKPTFFVLPNRSGNKLNSIVFIKEALHSRRYLLL